jgi:hypothetical protein
MVLVPLGPKVAVNTFPPAAVNNALPPTVRLVAVVAGSVTVPVKVGLAFGAYVVVAFDCVRYVVPAFVWVRYVVPAFVCVR